MYYLIPYSINSLHLYIYAEGHEHILVTTGSHTLPNVLRFRMRYTIHNPSEIKCLLASAVLSSPDPITRDSHPELFI